MCWLFFFGPFHGLLKVAAQGKLSPSSPLRTSCITNTMLAISNDMFAMLLESLSTRRKILFYSRIPFSLMIFILTHFYIVCTFQQCLFKWCCWLFNVTFLCRSSAIQVNSRLNGNIRPIIFYHHQAPINFAVQVSIVKKFCIALDTKSISLRWPWLSSHN